MTTRRERSANEQLVVEKVTLPDYYNQFIVPLDKKFRPMSQDKRTSLCPFHDDTDPSFHYWKDKNIFHCFGCGFGGDVISTHIRFAARYQNRRITPEQAVSGLATTFSVELLPEEVGFKVRSAFERARERLNQQTYTLPKGELTYALYCKENRKITNMQMPLAAKKANFAHLDLLASMQAHTK